MIKRILYKNDFSFEKYKELTDFANENNYIIEDKSDCYITREQTLEDFKEKKIEELKQARDDFKKTIVINGKTLFDIENKEHLKVNMLLGVGFTKDDKLTFGDRLLYISNTYDKLKQEINKCNTKEELDKLIFNFDIVEAQNTKIERKVVYESRDMPDDSDWAFSGD